MKYCSNCGNSVHESDNFCEKCGYKLTSTASSNEIIYPKSKYHSTNITVDDEKKYDYDLTTLFPKHKRLFWGREIPWKKFKHFVRLFESEELRGLEFLLFYDSSAFGSPAENGFAISRRGDDIFLLISSLETQQILVKVVAKNFIAIYSINNIFSLRQENNKLIFTHKDFSTDELIENHHSLTDNALITSALVNVWQNRAKINFANISGLHIEDSKLVENDKLNFKEGVIFFLIVFGIIAIVYRLLVDMFI